MQFFSYFLTETQQSCCHSPTSPTDCLTGLGDPAHVRAPCASRLSAADVKGLQGPWLLVLARTKLNDREPGSRLSGIWSSMGCFIICAEFVHWWGWVWSGHFHLFSCLVIFSWLVIHTRDLFLFSAEVLLCFRASDFPADLEILIHPEPPHLSPGMHSVFILRKSGSYRSEKWLHLITMIYLRISEGQRESIASRERCFLELLCLRMRKLHWPTKSKYFCHILVLSLCLGVEGSSSTVLLLSYSLFYV